MTLIHGLRDGAILLGVVGTMVIWGLEANSAARRRKYGRRCEDELRHMRLRQSWDSGPSSIGQRGWLRRQLDRLGDQASGGAAPGLGGGDGEQDSPGQAQGGGVGQVREENRCTCPICRTTARLPQQVVAAIAEADARWESELAADGRQPPGDLHLINHFFSPDPQLDGRACAICGGGPGGVWHLPR